MQWVQLIIALSFLVVIHELGHFAFARLFKVRVEKFYMFFNPKMSLFRMKKVDGKWRFAFMQPNVAAAAVEQKDPTTNEPKKDEKGNILYRPMTMDEINALPEGDWRRDPDNTEWGIGWVPFGGYCSIAGMVDETKAATDLPSEPQPWEYRSKKAWQRMLIILGGILVNFVAALIMFGAILHHWGEDSWPISQMDRGLYYSPLMEQEGFRQQDRILLIDSVEPEYLADVVEALIVEGKREVTVLRNEDTIRLCLSEDLGIRYLAVANENDRAERARAHQDKTYQKRPYVLISYFIPFVVDSVLENHAAYFGGMQSGDSVVSICGVETPCTVMVQNELAKHPNDSITVGFYRNATYMEARLYIGNHAKLGVTMQPLSAFYEPEHKQYGLLESIPAGIRYGWNVLESYIKQFKLVFTKEGAESLGGFGAIKNMYPTQLQEQSHSDYRWRRINRK